MMKEIEIPEGYKVKIENNKVIFVPKESEEQHHKSFCEENCKGYRDTGGRCFFDFNCSAKKTHEQPATPSNLNEAANKFAVFYDQGTCDGIAQDCFKAGAEWMTRQFQKIEEQEQTEVDLVAELKHHLAITPKEQLEKEWKELEPWGNIGPTVQEFLYEKQPKVDLEQFDKDVTEIWGRCAAEPNDSIACLHIETFIKVARHFWNKGYNARKEE